MQPSTYQQGFVSWVKNGRGDAVGEAVAGSGKTTVAVQCANAISTDSALFLAFNVHNVKTLQDRLKGRMECKTIHQVGRAIVAASFGKIQLQEDKYTDLINEAADRMCRHLGYPFGKEDAFECRDAIKSMVHFCRVTLTNPEDITALEKMADEYTIEFDRKAIKDYGRSVAAILNHGIRLAKTGKVIDFDDMLWLPSACNLPPAFRWQFMFVDECQDLSRAQLGIVLKVRAKGGRILFIGDRHQAIFGFAGANSRSVQEIIERTDATILPLSVCYRCPSSHLDLAREIVPQIEAAPSAIKGEIADVKPDDFIRTVQDGDLVLCRLTAPLIKQCLQLIAARIPARVRGRDIGAQVCTVVRDVAKADGFTYKKFGDFLEEYRFWKSQKLMSRPNNENALQSLSDKVECVRICFETFKEAESAEALQAEIKGLFDDNRPSVWLSTVHRAKGLEADRVFILQPEKLPLHWKGQQPWEAEQEQNIKYVALTRAKRSLFFVREGKA